MEKDLENLQNSLITIASELFRFQRAFERVVYKLDMEEHRKYMSQFSWFSKKVYKSLDEANLKILNLEGKNYDPGMAVTPLNIDDFGTDDQLYIMQTVEPIIMHDDTVYKTGTVILTGELKNEALHWYRSWYNEQRNSVLMMVRMLRIWEKPSAE